MTAMKTLPTKADLRREIDAHVRDFIEHGGEVQQVERGISGWEPGQKPLESFRRQFQPADERPREPRTPVPEVVAAIEARRNPPRPEKQRRRKAEPQRKPVLDDFGEPIRWVWTDEE